MTLFKQVLWFGFIILFGLVSGLVFGLGAHPCFASSSRSSTLVLQSSYEFRTQDLTTEKIWELDPQQKNPHIQRWVLSRQGELQGLKVLKNKDKSLGISAEAISVHSQGYIRAQGPWYRPWTEFGCETLPNSWFAQSEGAEIAVNKAAELWSTELEKKRITLEVLLSHIQTQSEDVALERARQLFRVWFRSVEDAWRERAAALGRKEEWKYYLETAKAGGFCSDNPKVIVPPTYNHIMEPVSKEDPTPVTRLLARAPVRLWDGLYSVRLSVNFAGRTLNGRFLIDSNAKTSVISPAWLDGQGLLAAWVVLPGTTAEPVTWSDQSKGERPLGRRITAQKVVLSGFTLPLTEFLLADTEFFSPPESLGSCCDGILGMDFLRLYPIEFRSTEPAEIRIWPRENFHPTPDHQWVELSESATGLPVSNCELNRLLQGVTWDTGSEEGLQINSTQSSRVKSRLRWSSADVMCDRLDVGTGLQPIYSDFSLISPPMKVGMPLLSQVDFTFDLPHGRIWFGPGPGTESGPAPVGLPFREPRQNRSGLDLQYVVENHERVLKVKSIRKTGPSASLLKSGLKVGMLIQQVDNKPAGDMDLWEVQRRLAGVYGKEVSLEWHIKGVRKIAPLVVR